MLRHLPLSYGCSARTSRAVLGPLAPRRRPASSSSNAPPAPASASDSFNLVPPRLSYTDLLTPEGIEALTANAQLRNAALEPTAIKRASALAYRRKEVITLTGAARSRTRDVGLRVKAREDGALDAAKALKEEISLLEAEAAAVERELLSLALAIPNATSAQTPHGPEANASLLASLGPPAAEADRNRDHLTVARTLGLVDFKSAAKVTGAGFYFLRGGLVVLEQALISYALDRAMRHGFEASTCPDVIRTDIASRCGFVPRDRDGSSASYHLELPPSTAGGGPSPRLSLAATSEIPLAGQSFCTLYPEESLPRRTVGLGTAYRTEAGKGSEVRGLYRVHAFKKVELFVVCEDGRGESENEMERLLALQQEIVRGLGLTVRVLEMPSEELGASAYRKVDMEAWMPGKNAWGEVSSTSNCTDYQARRLLITYRPSRPAAGEDKTRFAHTLNGTAAAIPRLLVALLENGVVLAPLGQEALASQSSARAKAQAGQKGRKASKPVEDELEGVEVIGFRLPAVLRKWWIGPEEMGGKPIEWL